MRNQRNLKRKFRSDENYRLERPRFYSGAEKISYTWFDPHKYITLRYCDSYSFTLAATTASSQVMNLNSLFDPDRTGVGHQPMGFDTLATIYNRYRVLKAKWKVVISPSTLTYDFCVLPLNGLLNTAPTTAATFNACVENPRAKFWTQGASGVSKSFVGSVSLNDLAGTTLTEYLADDRYEAANITSPSEVIVLYLVPYNPNASTITLFLYLQLDFECDWHDPTSQPQS